MNYFVNMKLKKRCQGSYFSKVFSRIERALKPIIIKKGVGKFCKKYCREWVEKHVQSKDFVPK